MKNYFISYSYYEDLMDLEDGTLSYGQKKFEATGVEQVIDSLYNEVQNVAAIYCIVND